ncbi:MAG: DNA methyltransferase [Candidatus Shapirobacteria bacterium]|jgi:tRNA (guanine10-N2)-dimethyltransferase
MNDKFGYCFILGNNHSLCKVEIINVLFSRKIDFKIVESSQETLIIEALTEIEKDLDIDIFGSIAKFVKIYKNLPLKPFLDGNNDDLVDYDFIDFFVPKDEKHPIFGLSVYGAGCRFKDLNTSWYLSPSFCRNLRDELKSYGIKNGFMPLRDRKLSTVSVDKNKLLTNGFEIILAIGHDTVYVGKTIAVQDYESYGFRDYGRPNRDSKSGMIPPKLAKMMINLAGKNTDQTILDPFCGSGTILEELILLGYQKIIGSDLSPKAVNDTNVNLKWLFEKYPELDPKKFDITTLNSDVTQISRVIKNKSIDAIVTEPFLGSPKRNFNFTQVHQEINRLVPLYTRAFSEFKKILSPSGTIVIISPVFRCQGKFLHLPILEKLKPLGFVPVDFLPRQYNTPENLALLNLELTERNSIVYYRADQIVSREIFLFKV